MKNGQDIIPIFFAIDDSYAPYLSTAVDSMIQNASPEHRYIAYIEPRACGKKILKGWPF